MGFLIMGVIGYVVKLSTYNPLTVPLPLRVLCSSILGLSRVRFCFVLRRDFRRCADGDAGGSVMARVD